KLQAAGSDLTQEETLGDFYFETRSYEAALQQYENAHKKVGQSHRLRRKILAAEYNIGVQHIKRREYARALKWMERVLEQDPKNQHAKKKILQLRKILDKMSASG
ncbi:MAG: tetratricopeptide repeat protein, partial [Candidatus Hydrogenedentota bacterium]